MQATLRGWITNLHGRRISEEKPISTAGFQRQVAQEAVPLAGRSDVVADDTDAFDRLRSLPVDRLGAAQVRVCLPRRQRPATRRRGADRQGPVAAITTVG